jgi:hypothetical protein
MRVAILASDIEWVSNSQYMIETFEMDDYVSKTKVPVVKAQVVYLKCDYTDARFFESLGGSKTIMRKQTPIKGLGTYYKPLLVSPCFASLKPNQGDKILCNHSLHSSEEPEYVIRTVKAVKDNFFTTEEGETVTSDSQWTRLILALPEEFTEAQIQAMVSEEITNEDHNIFLSVRNFGFVNKTHEDLFEPLVHNGSITMYTHTVVQSEGGALIEDYYTTYSIKKYLKKIKKFYTIEDMKKAFQAGVEATYAEFTRELISKDSKNTNKQRWGNNYVKELQDAKDN